MPYQTSVTQYVRQHALGLRASSRQWWMRVVFWTTAVAVGVVAAMFTFAGNWSNIFFQHIIHISPYLALVVCPAGLMLGRWLAIYVFPGSEGSGIPQVVAALKTNDEAHRFKLLSPKLALGKFFLTVLGLCSGAVIGREGPTVQIGAAFMYSIGRLFPGVTPDMARALMLSGGAAGVAAAFNAPLAGIIFAIEELSHSFEERTSGTVFTAIIVAGLTSLAMLGNYTYFGHTSSAMNLKYDLVPLVICAVLGGTLGGTVARLIVSIRAGVWPSISDFYRNRPIVFAGICGLILACAGLLSGSTIYGTGYVETYAMLQNGQMVPLSFGLLKMIGAFVSYLSGIPGGVFSAALATGAGFGANVLHFFPLATPGVVIVLGMVAYFTGLVQAPITAVVIVMEMIDNQAVTIDLMLTAIIAFVCSRLICKRSLYHALSDNFAPAPATTTEAS